MKLLCIILILANILLARGFDYEYEAEKQDIFRMRSKSLLSYNHADIFFLILSV